MSTSRIQSLLPDRQTEIYLLAWLGQAGSGEILEYHRGFLALDRSFLGNALNERRRIALGEVARCAMRLADQGLVHLLQRRICRDRYSYLAIARPHTDPRPTLSLKLMSEETV